MKYFPLIIILLIFFLPITSCKLHPTGRATYQECQNIPYEVQEEYTVDEIYTEDDILKHKPVAKSRTVTKYRTECD